MEKKLDEADKKNHVTLLKYGIKRVINIDTPLRPLCLLCGLCGKKNKTTKGTKNPQRARRKAFCSGLIYWLIQIGTVPTGYVLPNSAGW